MALIDRLLKKAQRLAYEILEVMYSNNDDGFIEALGFEPQDYAIVSDGEVVGYDDIKALSAACGVWDE